MSIFLTTAQFETGLPLLASLDFTTLFSTFIKLLDWLPKDKEVSFDVLLPRLREDPEALKILLPLVSVVSQAGAAQILRKVSAVLNASDAELLDAERNPAAMQALCDAAAVKPYMDTLKDVAVFFQRLGLSAEASPASFGSPMPPNQDLNPPALDVSPSEG